VALTAARIRVKSPSIGGENCTDQSALLPSFRRRGLFVDKYDDDDERTRKKIGRIADEPWCGRPAAVHRRQLPSTRTE